MPVFTTASLREVILELYILSKMCRVTPENSISSLTYFKLKIEIFFILSNASQVMVDGGV